MRLRTPLYLIALALTLVTTSASAQNTFVFNDFSDTSTLTLNGDATKVSSNGRDVLRLTDDQGGQAGSVFVTDAVDLSDQRSFSTSFSFRISDSGGGLFGEADGVGADGLVFVVQTLSNNVGSEGGGIGYQGITQSLGIEFDTFNNGSSDGFNGNHIGINLNGSTNSLRRFNVPGRMNDGDVLYAWVDYDGRTDLLEVRFSEAASRPALPVLSFVVDLTVVLGQEDAFVGFTSATGGAFNKHDVLSWTFINAFSPLGLPVACSPAAPLSFDFDGDADGEPTEGTGLVGPDDFNSIGDDATYGEFAGLRNESIDAAVDLSACSFVTFDPFSEQVTYATPAAGTVDASGTYVFATTGGDQAFGASDVLFDNPGAFALVAGTATVGDDVGTVFGRVVAAVVYDRDRSVYGSMQGGLAPAQTWAQQAAFAQAMARAFGQATPTEAGGAVDLAVTAWPNPSSGRATVGFGLAEGGAARVAVYDALGREVAVVADRAFGPGRHEAALPSSLPAGVYVVRVATEGGVQTTRLTVAR